MIKVDSDSDLGLSEAVISAAAPTGNDEHAEQEEEKNGSAFEIERKSVVCAKLLPELPPHKVPFSPKSV